jgi:hypothetical protein
MPMNLRLKSWYKYWPIAISIIVPFLGFAKFLLGNQALYWGTPLFQFYPWQIYTLQLLQNQQIPLWNHLNGMGAPLLANYQLAFFYPPSWLIYIAGSIWGTSGIIWGDHFLLYLHIVWACVGMAMLARKLGITPIGQVISGLAFGMSSYLLTRLGFFPIIFTIAWLPWVVISCDQLTGLSLRDYLKKAPVYIDWACAIGMVLPSARILLGVISKCRKKRMADCIFFWHRIYCLNYPGNRPGCHSTHSNC